MRRTKFYRKTLILSVLVLFLLTVVLPSSPALAQGVNLCTQPGAVPELNILSSTLQWGGWWSTASNINDNSESTYVGCYWESGGSRAITFQYETIVTFAQPASQITRVEYRRSIDTNFGGIPPPTFTAIITTYLWYNGQWNEINNETWVCSSWPYVFPVATKIIQGNWSNVSKVKVKVYRPVYNWKWNDIGNSKIYEIRAFGEAAPTYIDIGLRVYDQNVAEPIKIAAEPQGTLTSPLRIAKNGVVWGIVLVDPGDPNDSGVRIQTSSGTKALRKYP